jgi:hypothetical protein
MQKVLLFNDSCPRGLTPSRPAWSRSKAGKNENRDGYNHHHSRRDEPELTGLAFAG